MKLQLDTTNKTIKVEENVKISDLLKLLKKLLPGEYENFTLETHTTISYWSNPVIIREPYYEPYKYPWYVQTGLDGTDNKMLAMNTTENLSLKGGIFNVEA